jgi:hypothetical protein
MLARNDVLKLEFGDGGIVLRKLTILATVFGPSPNEPLGGLIHQTTFRYTSNRRVVFCNTAMN